MNIFSKMMAQFYDRIMADAEEKILGSWRSELLAKASGRVLEIGSGTGINLEYYPDAVTHLSLAEPDPNMRVKLQQRLNSKANSNINIEILNCASEAITAEDNSYDTVVSTLVLCTVNNPEQALKEIHRILKPNGKLIFIEHVAATNNPKRFKWQKRLEPFWKIIACGCCLTRDTETAINNAGFSFCEITRQSIRGVPAIVRPSIKGIAVKN